MRPQGPLLYTTMNPSNTNPHTKQLPTQPSLHSLNRRLKTMRRRITKLKALVISETRDGKISEAGYRSLMVQVRAGRVINRVRAGKYPTDSFGAPYPDQQARRAVEHKAYTRDLNSCNEGLERYTG